MGTREDAGDEAEVDEVEGHLVGEPCGGGVRERSEPGVGGAVEELGGETGGRIDGGDPSGIDAGDVGCESGDLTAFATGMHIGVACEDLLDECGAGSRHADDEDGAVGVMT